MMKKMRTIGFSLLLGLLAGCAGPDLKPAIKLLAETIKTVRTKDYQTGRVKFSDDKDRNAQALKGRIDRLKEAESLAAEALKED